MPRQVVEDVTPRIITRQLPQKCKLLREGEAETKVFARATLAALMCEMARSDVQLQKSADHVTALWFLLAPFGQIIQRKSSHNQLAYVAVGDNPPR